MKRATPLQPFAVTDFIDADQDLTKLYLDLAERHNTLVDSVEGFEAEQRARLGIKDEPPARRARLISRDLIHRKRWIRLLISGQALKPV